MKSLKSYRFFLQVLLLAPVMLCLVLNVGAQENFTLRYFDESQGLSSNFAEAITQSQTGHLIIANRQGIDRFDGKTFDPVTPQNDTNLLGYISSIYRSENAIWFGRFDGNIGYVDTNVQIVKTGIVGQIKHIYNDSRDGVWAFSRSGQVFWANGNDTSRYDMSERDLLINTVIPYKHKEFLIGSNDGLWLIRYESGNDFQVLRQIEGLPETRVTAINYDRIQDLLWVGTEDAGLHVVTAPFSVKQKVKEFQLSNGESIDDVQSIFTDHLQRIWLGTFGNGLVKVEFTKGTDSEFIAQTIGSEIDGEYLIRDIFQDNEQNIWIATFGGGLIQIVENIFHHPFDANWLREQSLTQLFRDSESNVWLGINKGIFKTSEHRKNANFKYYHASGNQVTAIAETPNGTIWLGTKSNGLLKFRKSTDKFEKVDSPNESLAKAINAILVGSKAIYVSTKAGLLIYDLKGRLKSRLNTLNGIPHNNVNYTYEDADGRVWLACQGNRVCYLWENQVRFIESNKSQTIVDVNHILQDSKGRIWFSTMGNGVAILDNGEVSILNQTNELPSDYCYQMVLDDDDNVWVSHQKSIAQISPDLHQLRLISREELTHSENSMIRFLFKDEEGSIWISSTNDVVKFNPLIDKSSKSKPQLSIASMQVFDELQPLVSGLSLPYQKYDITFRLAGISLRNPEGIKYKYQLQGASESWKIHEGSDKIFFHGLANGRYKLNVLASRNNGPWTEEPVSFQFTIERPFWLSWWFWVLFGAVVLVTVIMYVRWRTVRLLQDKEELEQVVQERTLEIQDQKTEIERSRDEIAKYAKDITDSIKYAKRIQKAIFPNWRDVREILPEVMVFYQSKDLVSGDFYLAEKVGNKTVFAAVDCTGHGVPGGFMSIVANNLLQQAIRQLGLTNPAEILDYANKGITNTLHQTYEESSVKDGMDVAMCCWDQERSVVEYAGAYNPLYLFRDGNLKQIKADRFPVGTFIGEKARKFTNHVIEVKSGDVLYIFSDGFADQFGGPKGKKFMQSRFRDLLRDIHTKSLDEQYDILSKTFSKWKGNLDQIDDVCVLGVRIS